MAARRTAIKTLFRRFAHFLGLDALMSGGEMARLYDVSEPTVSRIVAAYRQRQELWVVRSEDT
jgi:hypothetical protein